MRPLQAARERRPPATVLERIVAETREAARAAQARRRSSRLPNRPRPRGPRPAASARPSPRPGIGVIAEFKRRSPSAGTLRERPDLERILGAYERGGAVAVSILTEEPNFGGSLEDLERLARPARCRCCARTSSSTPTSSHEAARRGRRRDAADRRRARADDELAALHAGRARSSASTCSSRSTTRAELAACARAGRGDHRGQQPRPAGLQRRCRAHRAADGADARAGVIVVSESGISSPEQLERCSEARGAGRARGRDADARRRSSRRAEGALERLRSFRHVRGRHLDALHTDPLILLVT